MNKADGVPSSAVEDREPFGSFLRERREARGLSLDDAVVQTRIRRSFLGALEEDLFDQIPGETYVYGFLRTYAVFLGFDPDAVVKAYNQRFHGRPPTSAPARPEKGGKEGLQRWWIWGTMLVALGLIVAVVFVMCSRKDAAPPSADAVKPAVTEPEKLGEEPVFTEGVAVKDGSGNHGPPEIDPVPELSGPEPLVENPRPGEPVTAPVLYVPSGGALLQAEGRDTGWLDIAVDERAVQRYRIEPRVVLKWQIGQSFLLETERPGLLTLWFDGREVELGESTSLLVGPGSDPGHP
ncbi:MAG: helix-turn-helix domain-containing protein [Syntrophotaleaceae bacterium]